MARMWESGISFPGGYLQLKGADSGAASWGRNMSI